MLNNWIQSLFFLEAVREGVAAAAAARAQGLTSQVQITRAGEARGSQWNRVELLGRKPWDVNSSRRLLDRWAIPEPIPFFNGRKYIRVCLG